MDDVAPGALLEQLIDAHWATIARQAWKQYQRKGRGAVVFDLRAEEAPSDAAQQRPLRYLTFTDDDAAQTGAFQHLHRLTTTYTPTEEAVVAAVLPDGRTVFDVYARTPPPSNAIE
ncbi:hypothetical protein [Salisaeta longa]|uniref:hypothetical protein n=1 Tax=Salisaeta longa TaxID=503170 RepID=UPI0003B35412|nr:hypothetical protein [Salisaeta longa]